MSKGISALSYLPKVSVSIDSTATATSVEAYKALVSKLAELQANQTTLVAEELAINGNSPYVKHNFTVTSMTPATAVVTVATAVAGNTLTVNGLVYTGVTGAKANNTEFNVTGTDTEVAADLTDSINNDTRVGTIGQVTATSDAAVITLSQVGAKGTAGNGTTIVSSGATLAISATPFTNGVDFVVVSGTTNDVVTSAKGQAALSTRRLIEFSVDATSDFASLRSVLSVLKAAEKFEDQVASTGVSATADGTYASFKTKGATPWESFTWGLVKLGNEYTATATATS